jgi:hypothetical protein
MAYGSKVTSDGKPISADDTRIAPIVGIVDDCEIKTYFELNDDSSVATITFGQPNGSEIKHKEWNNEDDEKSIDDTNRRVKHICTKVMAENEYHSAVEGATGFVDFFNRVNKALNDKIGGKFRMIFHYNNKGYVTIPRYPNFIEAMSVVPSKLTLSAYVQSMLTRKATPTPDPDMDIQPEDLNTTVSSEGGVSNDLPF